MSKDVAEVSASYGGLFGKRTGDWNVRDTEADPQRLRPHPHAEHIGEEGEKLFAKADELGLEGTVAKTCGIELSPGTNHPTVKIKTSHGRHVDQSEQVE